jgi:tRNA pseudouridine65 synthase
MEDLHILYRDDHYIAVNKPSGLFVHRSALDPKADNALRILRWMCGRMVWPVHRLDRPTSGVVVFALSKDALRALSREFMENRVTKVYHAVVRGYTDPAGHIIHPLAAEKGGDPKHAETLFTRLKTVELPYPVGRYATARYSLVEARPLTGRNHQIRRHFDHIFHPVIGDRVYGDGRQNRFIREHFSVERLLLSARELSFIHPFTGRRLTVTAPQDPQMDGLIRQMFV